MTDSNRPPNERRDTPWPAGPWDTEPDRLEWRLPDLPEHPLLIVRGPNGSLCGYAGVAPGHPAHGKGYDDVEVDVHGGLTYAAGCSGHICHVPAPGEPDDIWWLGFDCTHAGDYSPGLQATIARASGQQMAPPYVDPPLEAPWHIDRYRDIDYVKFEVESLARQLAALAPPTSSQT